jgi:hypothetical protein
MMSPLSSLLNLNIGMPVWGAVSATVKAAAVIPGVAVTPGVTESEIDDF